MNKNGFIKQLSEKINYSQEDCIIINDILENNFFISKKNKDKIVNALIDRFSISIEEASKIYESAKSILNSEIKYKLKHPFKSID